MGALANEAGVDRGAGSVGTPADQAGAGEDSPVGPLADQGDRGAGGPVGTPADRVGVTVRPDGPAVVERTKACAGEPRAAGPVGGVAGREWLCSVRAVGAQATGSV